MRETRRARIQRLVALFAGVIFIEGCTSSSDSGGPDASEAGNSADARGQDVSSSPADATTGDAPVLGDATADGSVADGIGQAQDGSVDGRNSDAGPGADASLVDAAPESGSDGAPGDAGGGNPLDGSLFCTTPSCPAGVVLAGTHCVSPNDPATGCAAGTSPCSAANALMGCNAGACVVVSCNPGWADCDHDPSNGCEADLASTANCTACGMACATGSQCTSNGCVSACTAPDTNCAGTCRNLASDIHACGGCNITCSVGETCDQGACVCAAGYAMCGGGCVDTNSASAACGPSCQNCAASVLALTLGQTDSPQCLAGVCTPVCFAPYRLCGPFCVNTSTDPNQCGSCGNACPQGDVCVAGSCQPGAANHWITGVAPTLLAQDALRVYWTDPGDDTIDSAPKATGQKTVLASSNSNSLAIDDAYVYWADPSTGIAYRVPQTGGSAPTPLATFTTPKGIAVDATNLYAFDGLGNYATVAKTGGTPTPLATLAGAQDFASDGTFLYSTVSLAGTTKGAYRIDAHGTISAIASTTGMGTFSTMSADAHGAYWLFREGGTVVETYGGGSLALLGGGPLTPTLPFMPAVPSPVRMATDGCHGIYWTTGGADLWFWDGYPAQIVAGGTHTTAIVVDNNYVYWTDAGGWVGRVAKH